MNITEATKICTEYLEYLEEQRDLTKKMQQLAALSRYDNLPSNYIHMKKREIEEKQRLVYDASSLEKAIKCLIASK